MQRMPASAPNPPPRDIARFFLLFALLFGIAARLYPLLNKDFPLVDGGMFYTMIGDLQRNHFALPVFTTYNQSNIPFAYPPLALYVTGFIQSATRLPLTSLIQWLPFAVNLLILPLFFFFAKQILHSEPGAALATLIFALTPNSYWWEIVGGGLTRAPGALFFLLTALCADRMVRERRTAWIVATALCGALTVLTHPEWALQSAAVIFLFWCFYGRDKQGVKISLAVLASVALLTVPWWLAVLGDHGWDIFFQAAQATKSRWLFWTVPFAMSFSGEYTPVIAALGVYGLFIYVSRKDFLLPAWALLCLFVDPRGGLPASVIPFSMLAATALADGIAAQLVSAKEGAREWTHSLNTAIGRLFWGFILLLFLYGAIRVSSTLASHSLTRADRDAMDWVSANTEPADRFLILDDQDNPLLSPWLEWFPALAERNSIATVQGSEWLAGEQSYAAQMAFTMRAHQCLFQEISCLETLNREYEYIIISNDPSRVYPLLLSLENSMEFEMVYESGDIRIFCNLGR